jgi:glycerol-3-phosphate dehydrogenase
MIMRQKKVFVDVAIFGGGIAGLWLLTRLRKSGLAAVLFESNTLGGGQTGQSQGIIHGGLKYALQGVMTKEARGMADMPARFQACLSGHGEIDLSRVPILSPSHYLWAPNQFAAKMTGFFASKSLSGQVSSVDYQHYPALFQHPAFKGGLYALDEVVLDIPQLVSELVQLNQDVIFKIEPFSINNRLSEAVTVYQAGKALDIVAKQYIFAAGSGNEALIKQWPETIVSMQRRPLQMVLVKTPFSHPLYAHCLALGPRPRLTVTTHYRQDGSLVWYLGGALAEDGVSRREDEQIIAAKKELETLFPWLNFTEAHFKTVRIDRAEPKQVSGLKPEGSYMKAIHNQVIVWPTKLTLAPQLADQVLAHFQKINLTPVWNDIDELRSWSKPLLATPIWESAFCNDVH